MSAQPFDVRNLLVLRMDQQSVPNIGRPRYTAFLLVFVLCACSASEPIPPPTQGFSAARFKQSVDVRDHAINLYTFQTGSIFVADRHWPNGVAGPIYCGTALRNDVVHNVPTCFALEGDTTLILNANCPDLPAIGCRVHREIPAGSVEVFRMNR
jgi:hypothetical protein